MISGRLVIFLAALGLFVAALGTAARVPLFDPDEGFYPATAAESVAAGTWWDLRFNGEPRWDKPILAYALIEGSFALFGRNTVAARVPSAIEGAVLVWLIGTLLTPLVSARAGACASVVLASSLGVQIFARAAHPEIAIVLSIAVTQLLLIRWLIASPASKPRGLAIVIGLSIGFGLLAKGPLAIVVPLIGAVCAAPFVTSLKARWIEALRDALVSGLVGVAIAAPWYVAMTMRHGWFFLENSLWAQNVGRFTGTFNHGQSALTFIAAAVVGLMPWTGVLPAALARSMRPGVDRRNAVRFTAMVMAMASLIFYAASASRLASYSLALLPPLAVLIGVYLDEVLNEPRKRISLTLLSTAVALALLAAALLTLPSLLGSGLRTRDLIGGVPAAQDGSAFGPLVAWVSAALLVGALLIFVLPDRGRILALYGVGIAVPLIALITLAPLLNDAYPWRRFGEPIARSPAPAWIQNYRASSLTFYAAQPITRVGNDEELTELLKATDRGWVILGADWADKAPLADLIRTGRARIVERSQRLALVELK